MTFSCENSVYSLRKLFYVHSLGGGDITVLGIHPLESSIPSTNYSSRSTCLLPVPTSNFFSRKCVCNCLCLETTMTDGTKISFGNRPANVLGHTCARRWIPWRSLIRKTCVSPDRRARRVKSPFGRI